MVVTLRVLRQVLLSGLILALLAEAAAAQSAASAAATAADAARSAALVPRVLALYFEAPDNGFTTTVTVLAYETLVQELRRAIPDAVIIEPPFGRQNILQAEFPAVPGQAVERDRAARERGADAWLLVNLSGELPTIDVRYEFEDLLVPDESASGTYRKMLDSRYRNLSGSLWAPVANDLRNRLKPREVRVGVTFQGIAGTRIAQLGGAKTELTLGAHNSGSQATAKPGPPNAVGPAATRTAEAKTATSTATILVPAPGTYRFRATLPGYYPQETGVTLDQKAVTVSLENRRKSHFTFDFTMTQMSFPGLAVAYQILPETLFARVSFETYLIGAIPFGSTGSDYDRNNSNRPFFISLGSSSFGVSGEPT